MSSRELSVSVFAVIVTYNSSIERLDKLLSSLYGQCKLLLIDNSTDDLLQGQIQVLCRNCGAMYVPLGCNFGIAKAQNIGIAIAKKGRADFVLLMDDDSVPPNHFVSSMIKALNSFPKNSVVLSARTINENGEDVSRRTNRRLTDFTPCSELTSSGTLIPIKIMDAVGPFDEKLFIDCVDFEWGWRARSLGFSLLLCNKIFIQHRLGLGSRFGFKIPSPVRHYYQYRNIPEMILRSRAPFFWRIAQFFKLPVKLILIIFLSSQPVVRLRYAFLGFVHFIQQRFGKLDV